MYSFMFSLKICLYLENFMQCKLIRDIHSLRMHFVMYVDSIQVWMDACTCARINAVCMCVAFKRFIEKTHV